MTGPLLDLRRLRYFRMVATHGSFSAAARAHNLSQPALTHHVGELERTFRLVLFERSHRGVRLTPAGHRLLRHATEIFDRVSETEAELWRMSAVPAAAQPLRLLMSPSLSDSLAAPLIAELSARYPEMTLRVSEALHMQCHAAVSAGEVELAVSLPDPNWPDGHSLVIEPLYFIAKASEETTSDPTVEIRFEEVLRHRLILPSNENVTRQYLERVAASLGLRITLAAEINGEAPRRQAVIAGLGSTVLAWGNVAHEHAGGLVTAQPIVDPPLKRELILRSSSTLDPDVAAAVRSILQRLLLERTAPYPQSP